MMPRRRWLLPLFLVALAPLHAHDTWLLAQRAQRAEGGPVTLDLTSGMAFPTLDYAVKPERVSRAACRLGAKTSDLKRRPAPHSLRFTTRLEAPGVAACWVALGPKTLELTPEKVTEYFEEIDPPAAIRQAWAAAGPKRRWRETYVKHAKTFVRVGPPGSGRSWAEPVGLGLEIVPQSDPTALRPSGELPVQLLKKGKPLAGLALALVREGDPKAVFQTTDAEGRARFQVPRSGRYLLRATELRPAGSAWESDFTTLTLTVSPR